MIRTFADNKNKIYVAFRSPTCFGSAPKQERRFDLVAPDSEACTHKVAGSPNHRIRIADYRAPCEFDVHFLSARTFLFVKFIAKAPASRQHLETI
jgi:hypothetical protein